MSATYLLCYGIEGIVTVDLLAFCNPCGNYGD